MNRFRELVLLILSLPWLTSTVQCRPGGSDNSTSKLLYILIDGFRHDYLEKLSPEEVPGFTEFISNGVRAEYVNPLHPSLSYPSWTALATGLYAESHGIIGNYFYDPVDKDYFALFDADSTGKKKWWTAEPIWTTATKAGLRVAAYLWSRCDIVYDHVLPEYCEKFIKKTGLDSFRTNVDKALDNFEDGFDFVLVYTAHMDTMGHHYGPDSEEVKQGVRDIDEILVYLLDQLKEIEDQVNIVIVGDHGMSPTRPSEIGRVFFDKYLPQADCIENIADYGALSNILVKPGYLDEVYESLNKMPGFSVYKRDEIPEEWHIKNSPYIHDLFLQADIGNYLTPSLRPEMLPPVDEDTYVEVGAHGFLASEMDMKTIFFAKGPMFKTHEVISPIDIVDVYQVLTHVFNIEGCPSNGTFDNVAAAFV
uniref:Ectonucleotide pyrophosphatase/phosphodiesterase family member 6 n=1 Tax=Hirondellea gigas TaxID=1518452 RepID=A0A2P2HXN9_9CRUS